MERYFADKEDIVSYGALHEGYQAGMQDAEFSGQTCTTTLDCTRDQPVGFMVMELGVRRKGQD